MHSTSPVVLIVGDHEDVLAMYAFGLLAMGFLPVTARTTEEAIARARDVHPNVIVTDVTSPGTRGLELTRRLRENANTKRAGIIALIGHAGASIQQQAEEAGCDCLVLKPCLPDALALAIRDVLDSRIFDSRDADSL
jgi:two-component system, cell cycle response regulator DivK